MATHTPSEPRKQCSVFLPVSEWTRLRHEAARRRIPITDLVREWMQPHLDRLPAIADAD